MYPNGQQGPGSDPNAPQNPYQTPEQQQGFGQPQQAAPMFQIQPEPAAKSKKKLLITILIAAGALILIAGAALYVILAQMQTAVVQEEEKVAPLQPALTIQSLKKAVKEAYPAAGSVDTLAVTAGAVTVTDVAEAPAYQPDGYQYRIQYNDETGFAYEAPVPTDTLKDTSGLISVIVEDAFKANDLILSESQGIKELNNGTATKIYSGRGAVCAVNYVNTEATQKGTVSCGETETYKKIAADVQPFADLLTTVTPQTTLKQLIKAESDAGGYQRAALKLVDDKGVVTTAYFHKADAGRWLSLATSATAPLQCSVYSTVEAQRAYLNVPCLDAQNKLSKVAIAEKK